MNNRQEAEHTAILELNTSKIVMVSMWAVFIPLSFTSLPLLTTTFLLVSFLNFSIKKSVSRPQEVFPGGCLYVESGFEVQDDGEQAPEVKTYENAKI